MAKAPVKSKSSNATEESHDVWFNPYRQPRTSGASALVQRVVAEIKTHEKRKRTRKAKDQETFDAIASALISDIVYFYLSRHPAHVGLTLSRANDVLGGKSRYRPKYYNKTTALVLDFLDHGGFCTQKIGTALDPITKRRIQTVVRPGAKLSVLIEQTKLRLPDFRNDDKAEVIVLKDNRPDNYFDRSERAKSIEYTDRSVTRKFRSEVQAINAWLEQADIDFDLRVAQAAGLDPRQIDIRNLKLRRIFTRRRFDSGGRLFGGFWQTLPKQVRIKGLRIEGEGVVSLDYSEMNPRITYGLLKQPLPKRDAYTTPWYPREGVKKLFNAMLFVSKPLRRWPSDTKLLFPNGVSVKQVAAAIEQMHAGIKNAFYCGLGHEIQFTESEIMVAVLLKLKAQNIVAQRWSRLSEQIFRVDKWSVCRG
jgi:hypothetical protein